MEQDFLRPEEIQVLHTRFLDGDQEAGWKIVIAYERFLRAQCRLQMKSYSIESVHYDDLFTGLQLAAYASLSSFKPTKGAFGTHLRWHVRNCAKGYAHKVYTGITIPTSAQNKIVDLRRLAAALSAEDAEVTTEKLAAELGLREQRVRELMPFMNGKFIAERSTVVGEDGELVDYFEQRASSDPTVEEILVSRDQKERYLRALATLSDREQDILLQRYPDDSMRGTTLDVLGNKYDITRERVRQIEQKAIEKVRKTVVRQRRTHLIPVKT